MTWLLALLLPARAATCDNGRLQVGVLDQVWLDEAAAADGLVGPAEHLVWVTRAGDGRFAPRTFRATPGMPICDGDLLETWHGAWALLLRDGLVEQLSGTLVLHPHTLLRIGTPPRQLSGLVDYFFQDDQPRAFDWTAVEWGSGRARACQALSSFQLQVDGDAAWLRVSDANDPWADEERGAGHRVGICVGRRDEVVATVGGGEAALFSSAARAVRSRDEAWTDPAFDAGRARVHDATRVRQPAPTRPDALAPPERFPLTVTLRGATEPTAVEVDGAPLAAPLHRVWRIGVGPALKGRAGEVAPGPHEVASVTDDTRETALVVVDGPTDVLVPRAAPTSPRWELEGGVALASYAFARGTANQLLGTGVLGVQSRSGLPWTARVEAAATRWTLGDRAALPWLATAVVGVATRWWADWTVAAGAAALGAPTRLGTAGRPLVDSAAVAVGPAVRVAARAGSEALGAGVQGRAALLAGRPWIDAGPALTWWPARTGVGVRVGVETGWSPGAAPIGWRGASAALVWSGPDQVRARPPAP